MLPCASQCIGAAAIRAEFARQSSVIPVSHSKYACGRVASVKKHILEVIDRYASDYRSLKTHADPYPEPDRLRQIAKQGALDRVMGPGVSRPTQGSAWIVQQARRDDPRPLWVLVWGGLEPEPAAAEGIHAGARSVNRWREAFLRDFSDRLLRTSP